MNVVFEGGPHAGKIKDLPDHCVDSIYDQYLNGQVLRHYYKRDLITRNMRYVWSGTVQEWMRDKPNE